MPTGSWSIPVYRVYVRAYPISSVMVSKRLTATDPPRRGAEPRPTNNASTEMAEYRPVQRSATGGPAFEGVPGNPVMAHDPDSACANRSYARLCESGPPAPK